MAERNLVLRHATGRDAKTVTAFYSQNAHDNLKRRGDDELIATMEHNRKLFILEAGGTVVGAAGVFEHFGGEYHECGAARVILNGYGLQRVLLWVRTIHTFMTDPPKHELFSVVTSIDNENCRRSFGSLRSAGFEEWTYVPEAVLKAKGDTKRFLRLPQQKLVLHAQELLKVQHGPLTHRSTGDTVRISVSVESMAYYLDAVQALAAGDLSQLAEWREP